MIDEYTYEQLCTELNNKKELWVRLYDGIRICLTGIQPGNDQRFVARFIPCSHNSRVYSIPFDKIKEITGGRHGECVGKTKGGVSDSANQAGTDQAGLQKEDPHST